VTYQVLARRWRPQRFEDLVGQEIVVRTLRNALASRQVHHAYLFSGLRGVGKTTVARLLAKALNCDHGPTPEPCGECIPCREIAAGNAPDVMEIDAASNTGIDNVRDLQEHLRNLPFRDRYRVIILDEAHQLSKNAFNALLKVLEEPPAHVVFILASTEKEKFPATILSRCLQVDFRPIPTDVVASRMLEIVAKEGFELTPEAAHLISRATVGSLRDALSLLDRVHAFTDGAVDETAVAEVIGLPPFDVLLALWQALEAGDVGAALGVVRGQEAAGRDSIGLYEELTQLIHELTLLSCDPEAPTSFPAAHRDSLRASALRLGAPLLIRLLGMALDGRSLVAGAERPGLVVAVAVGRLALWPRLQRVEALLGGEPAAAVPAVPRLPQAAARPRSTQTAATAPAHGPDLAAAPLPSSPAQILAAALEEAGAKLLAARIRSLASVEVRGTALVLKTGAQAPAAVRSLRDGLDQLVEAARRAGLPATIEIENGGQEAAAELSLRQQVETDPGVRRVLEIFGGRIEKVEETG
jgi:DNA polymerase-3 subunit gamma/tau